jgi:hypothetical protein
MDKAMELKEKKNAMLPSKKLSGIMNSNPFHVLQSSEFIDMSSKLGVVITTSGKKAIGGAPFWPMRGAYGMRHHCHATSNNLSVAHLNMRHA